MIIDRIEAANIAAMKERNKVARAILSYVITRYKNEAIELKAIGKDISDVEMVKIINKVLKELVEEKEGYETAGNKEEVISISHQMEIVKTFLPQLMNEDEIREEIAKLEDKSMPTIMKHFKANFDGKVDMSLVSKIAREK